MTRRFEDLEEHDCKGTQQTQYGEEASGTGRDPERNNGVSHYVRPERDQLLECVAGLSVAPVEMLDRNAGDVACGPQEESLKMRVLALILDNIISYELADDPETRGFEIFRFADQYAHGCVVDPAAEIAESAVVLLRIVTVDYVVALIESLEQRRKLGWVRLKIVVHAYDYIALGVVEAGHYGVVLTGVQCKLNDVHVLVLVRQFFKNTQGLSAIGRAVIHKDEFERRSAQLLHLGGCQLDCLAYRMR